MRRTLIAVILCGALIAPTVQAASAPADTVSVSSMETSCYEWAASGGRDVMKGILCAIYVLWTGDFNYDHPW